MKVLKAEIDEDLFEVLKRAVPLPTGKYKRIASKIVDDREVESLNVVGV